MEQMIDNYAMGWLPDYPDFRDFSSGHDRIPQRLIALGQKSSVKAMLAEAGIPGGRAAGPSRVVRSQAMVFPGRGPGKDRFVYCPCGGLHC